MDRILICSIIRNRKKHLDKWLSQIKEIVEYYKDQYLFDLSVYENDSVDGTQEHLTKLDYSFLNNFNVSTRTVNTKYFTNSMDKQRVINLSEARNNCIYCENLDIRDYKKLLFIEPDYSYTLQDAIKVIDTPDCDIVSGVSIYKDSFYDRWATRKTHREVWGEFPIKNEDTIEQVWSTFNGFCLYNAEPFKKNIKFDWYNERFEMFDCDTAVVCENFRRNGYINIVMHNGAKFYHED